MVALLANESGAIQELACAALANLLCTAGVRFPMSIGAASFKHRSPAFSPPRLASSVDVDPRLVLERCNGKQGLVALLTSPGARVNLVTTTIGLFSTASQRGGHGWAMERVHGGPLEQEEAWPLPAPPSLHAVAAAPLDHCQDKTFMASMQGRPSRGQGLAGNRAAPCAVRRSDGETSLSACARRQPLPSSICPCSCSGRSSTSFSSRASWCTLCTSPCTFFIFILFN